jgi:tyrosyl-tRNA synthetase
MTQFRSDFLRVLHERGFVHQVTDLEALDAAAAAGPIAGYIGFDATAPSLHVGSLVQIMMLRWLQKTGHRAIVLMGGATTRIGDPTGKDTARSMLSEDVIGANLASIRTVFEHFLSFGPAPSGALMVDNYDWTAPLGYLDFLRTYGPHFTINRMLSFDSVRLRLEREQPLSFLEFNYMLMQAVGLPGAAPARGLRAADGRSDQWGNIVNGVELRAPH